MTEMNTVTEAGQTTNAEKQIHNHVPSQTQAQPLPNEKTQAQKLFQILSVLLYAFIFVRLFLWGGWGFGFFLFVLLTEVFLFSWALQSRLLTNTPLSKRQKWPLRIRLTLTVLTAVILGLAACYAMWSNPILRLLNFPVLVTLMLMQYLIIHRIGTHDWDQLFFWLEAGLSLLVRPFHCLSQIRSILPRPNRQAHPPEQRKKAGKQLGAVLFGILIALPLLLIAGSLLAAADAVFAERLAQLKTWFDGLSLSLLARQILLAVIFAPFVFSVMESGRQQKQIVTDSPMSGGLFTQTGDIRQTAKTVLITILIAVNSLYLFFAVIQFQYLTGAIQAMLPEHLTYAEYARSGFFELLAISLLNLALLTVSIRLADREHRSGLALRLLVLLLLGCSIVQWLSAMTRMRLYVTAYGLTRLRFLSTAFMWLILAWFVILILREFIPRLPLFKLSVTAAVAALLALNVISPDLRIAQFNIGRYQNAADQSVQLDVSYLQELSDDALPALLPLINAPDPAIAGSIREHLSSRQDALRQTRWQSLSLRQVLIRKELGNNLK